MPQYNNNNYNNYNNQATQTTSCNTANCSRCRNKQGCYKYLSYLENIVNSTVVAPIPSPAVQNVSQPVQSADSNVSSVIPTEQVVSTLMVDDINTEQVETSEQAVTLAEPILTSNIDLSSIIQSNAELKDSMLEIVLNKFLILESRYKILQETNESLASTLTGMDEKFNKLDKLITMIDAYGAQTDPKNGGLSIYNGESEDKVLVEKKGFFGRTKYVEEDKK